MKQEWKGTDYVLFLSQVTACVFEWYLLSSVPNQLLNSPSSLLNDACNRTRLQHRADKNVQPEGHLDICYSAILSWHLCFFPPLDNCHKVWRGGGSTCASGAVQHQYLRQHSNILSLGKRNFKYRSSPWNRHCQAGAWANKATHTKFTQTPYDTQMVGSLQPFNQTLHNTVTT